MRYATLLTFALVSSFCMGQELSKPTWRGSVWALGAASDRETAGGGAVLHGVLPLVTVTRRLSRASSGATLRSSDSRVSAMASSSSQCCAQSIETQ